MSIVDTIIVLNFNEIEDYPFPLDELFGLEVYYNSTKYEFVIKFASDNPNLLCFGAGYRSQDKDGKWFLPYFPRWSWYKYFKESFISYADPIFHLNDELGIGWYVGNKNEWYLEIISKIIEKLLYFWKKGLVENVFSVIKRIFNGTNKSKSTRLRNKETRLKTLFYNIYRYNIIKK